MSANENQLLKRIILKPLLTFINLFSCLTQKAHCTLYTVICQALLNCHIVITLAAKLILHETTRK
jgi:hypothetical protein